MILTIDVGNSNITLGGFESDNLVFVARVASDPRKTEDEYAAVIKGVLAIHDVDCARVKGAIISSVVPPLNSIIKKAVSFLFGTEALLVGPGIKTGLNIHCDDPSSVGADLICACVAARSLYGAPALIVDMGTATKMMVIDGRGAFVGVSIMPGVQMGLDALSEGTAQLPKVSLEAPGKIIGKNTVDCIKSGALYGHAAMIDGMIDRIKADVGAPLPVYATGGYAPLIVPHCTHEIVTDDNLVINGLNIIFKKNN